MHPSRPIPLRASTLNKALALLRGVGIAAAIAAIAAAIQGVRLPAVLDGPTLRVAMGSATDPHFLTGFVNGAILHQCALAAPCVQHWNLGFFAVVIFALGLLASGRALAQAAVAIVAISPLAVAAIADPLGASLSIGLLLTALAGIDIARLRPLPMVGRCALAIALALADPALTPLAIAYGAFGGAIPLGCAALASLLHLLMQPAIDPIAGPATLVAFGACLFIGGPLLILAVRFRAFKRLDDDGRALLRAATLAVAAIAGGLFSASGDPAIYWLGAEAVLLAGLVASLGAQRGKVPERTGIAFAVLVVVQFVLFVQHHGDVTTAAIAYRGDDLRGMIADAPGRTCVTADATATRYVLAGGAFLERYPVRRTPTMLADPAGCIRMPNDTTVVTMRDLAVNNWGQAVPLLQAYRDASDPAGVLQIEGGSVSPGTTVNTPTGRGAFGNEVDTPLGHVGDFTVLSGFAYTPACVPVRSGQHLNFSAASIPGTPDLRLRVTASGTGAPLLNSTFPASAPNRPYRWIRYSVPLAASDCTTFTFAMNPGSREKYWLTFAGAAVR